METLKKLWAPISGFIGAVTLVVEFIQLWNNDQAKVTYVIAILSGALVIFGFLWVGLSRRTYEVPDFIEPGKTKVKRDWQYAKIFRYLAFGSLLVCFLGGFVGAIALVLRRQALEAKTVILVARFDGPEDTYRVRDELLEQLRDATKDYEDIEIMPRGETITVEQGGEYARKVGKRFQADIVIWGWYSETQNPNVTVHIENLAPTRIILVETDNRVRPNANISDLESFELQQGLGKEMSAMVLFISGYAHYVAEDYSGALHRFERATAPSEWSNNPINRADALFYKARTYFFLHRSEEAVATYTEAIQIDPKHGLSYLNRGVANYFLNDHGASIADYRTGLDLLDLEPQLTADVYTNLGVAYYSLQNLEEAQKNYTQAIKLDPEDFLAFYNRCIAYTDLHRYEDANTDCDRAIELNPSNPNTYINRGITYDERNLYQEAIASYDKAIELDRNSILAYYNRGNTYFSLQQYQKAITNYDEAIHLDPTYGEAYSNRGDAYLALGNLEEAKNNYSQAIDKSPELVIIYFKRGETYLNLGQYEEAIADYTEGIERDDSDPVAYFNRGLAHFFLGQYEEASSDYTEGIQRDSSNAEAYFNRGFVYYLLEKYEEAISDETEAINRNPQNIDAYCIRGLSYSALDKSNKDAAKIDLETCVERATNPQFKQMAEEALQGLNNP